MNKHIGRVFTFWTVVGVAERRGTSAYLSCRCRCGAVREVAFTSLLSGISKSCGCFKVPMNLSGKRFGKLTVVGEAGREKGARFWHCRCKCGRVATVKQSLLRNKNTTSCGCVRAARIVAASTTHGMTGTREYAAWQRMKARCTNPLHKDFARYGGRGITVCKRWLDSFAAFYADMGPRPPRSSIDRFPNNDGNYEPGNCRWATQRQQCRNKGNNVMLTHNGETLCMTEWAERLGIKPGTLQTRLVRYKWPVARALSAPVGGYEKKPEECDHERLNDHGDACLDCGAVWFDGRWQ